MALFISLSAFSQDPFDKLIRQGIVIDSLTKKINKDELENKVAIENNNITTKVLKDSVRFLRNDLIKLEKFRKEKGDFDKLIKLKSDSIEMLKNKISIQESNSVAEKRKNEQRILEEKELGKNEVLDNLVKYYSNTDFDDLINTNTLNVVNRDIQLIGEYQSVKQKLNDLKVVFEAKSLLENKLDKNKVKSSLIQLNKINQPSKILSRIKVDVEYFEMYNDELKKTIKNIIDFDGRKSTGGDTETQQMKFNSIMIDLSKYSYNYYNFVNYPYISEVFFQIINVKRKNADTNISYLQNKL